MRDAEDVARDNFGIVQAIGVFGSSPDDPEPALQKLVDVAMQGSSLHLYFGPTYWSNFIAARNQQLENLEPTVATRQKMLEAAGVGVVEHACHDQEEFVSPELFEMRLIERIMRECHTEEQRCEEELVCATRLLERTAVNRDDILTTLRTQAAQTEVTASTPQVARSLEPQKPPQSRHFQHPVRKVLNKR